MTTVVSIGRNVSHGPILTPGQPLSTEDWEDFKSELRHALAVATGREFFHGDGVGRSAEWGVEQSFTVVAGDISPPAVEEKFYRDLQYLRDRFGQEAIAVTRGTTEFV